jgi:hypothetical protein
MAGESEILLGNIFGHDEEVIREDIRNQENEDARLEQLSMWK